MNILFFLKPKSEVAFIYDYSTLRQVLETMEFHKYASIPMLNKAGEYVGTMTEGDILWGIKKYTNLNLKEAETIFIQDFPRKADYEAVSADADMEDLLQKAMNQNFVPVVDDQKKFIGIITRKSIIEYCYEKIKKLSLKYGYAKEVKEYKQNPENYKGHVGDVCELIRVSLTSSTKTPDLYQIMNVLGETRVKERMNKFITYLDEKL